MHLRPCLQAHRITKLGSVAHYRVPLESDLLATPVNGLSKSKSPSLERAPILPSDPKGFPYPSIKPLSTIFHWEYRITISTWPKVLSVVLLGAFDIF